MPGWHPVERDAAGCFAWTGPEPRALVRLDAPRSPGFDVRVVVRYAVLSEQLDRLQVDVDGVPLALRRSDGSQGGAVFTGSVPPRRGRQIVEVGLTAIPRRPRETDPASADGRLLGVAVSEIALY